jgi:hypothetical protein
MKAIQKLMMMSAVYRQSSHVSQEKMEKDPENRLLARSSRFRLTGEVIRDQSLAVSGLLAPKIGGPSVRPYMPEGVWDETSKYGNLRNYKHESGESLVSTHDVHDLEKDRGTANHAAVRRAQSRGLHDQAIANQYTASSIVAAQ